MRTSDSNNGSYSFFLSVEKGARGSSIESDFCDCVCQKFLNPGDFPNHCPPLFLPGRGTYRPKAAARFFVHAIAALARASMNLCRQSTRCAAVPSTHRRRSAFDEFDIAACLSADAPTNVTQQGVVSILGSARRGFAPGQTRSAKCRRRAALLAYRRGPSSMGVYSRRRARRRRSRPHPAPITTI